MGPAPILFTLSEGRKKVPRKRERRWDSVKPLIILINLVTSALLGVALAFSSLVHDGRAGWQAAALTIYPLGGSVIRSVAAWKMRRKTPGAGAWFALALGVYAGTTGIVKLGGLG